MIPAQAEEFDDPTASNTTFRALQEGEAVLQITASDSLFLATGECRVTIGAETQRGAVSLAVDPLQPTADSPAQLLCTSIATTPVATFEIEQTSGETVTLTPSSDGVFLFTPTATQAGTIENRKPSPRCEKSGLVIRRRFLYKTRTKY